MGAEFSKSVPAEDRVEKEADGSWVCGWTWARGADARRPL